MKTHILSLGLLLWPSPSEACHHYSTWHYPWAQSCAVGHRPTAHAEPKVWYVEITTLPPLPETIPPQTIKKLNDQLLTLSDTTHYEKTWIAQCLSTYTPSQCAAEWAKLQDGCSPHTNPSCAAPGEPITPIVPTPKKDQQK